VESKKKLYIHHHLGLGDHLDCNGMIRYMLKNEQYDNICVFAKSNYFNLIKYMFRDEPKISLIKIDKNREYEEVNKYIQKNNISNLLRVGHENYPWGQEEILGLGCAEIFYKQVNIDYEERFKSFYYERDDEEEQRVYEKLNPNNEDFAFVHDDQSRGFLITDFMVYKLFGKRIKIVRNDASENIFHFTKILEEAKQIHCMESCFRSLVETTETKGDLFFHNFRAGASGYLGKSTIKPWKEVKW